MKTSLGFPWKGATSVATLMEMSSMTGAPGKLKIIHAMRALLEGINEKNTFRVKPMVWSGCSIE